MADARAASPSGGEVKSEPGSGTRDTPDPPKPITLPDTLQVDHLEACAATLEQLGNTATVSNTDDGTETRGENIPTEADSARLAAQSVEQGPAPAVDAAAAADSPSKGD